jgi:hypothetical protein
MNDEGRPTTADFIGTSNEKQPHTASVTNLVSLSRHLGLAAAARCRPSAAPSAPDTRPCPPLALAPAP